MSLEAIVTRTTGARPVAILALHGEISSETAPTMDESLDALLRDVGRVVLDLTHTLFVSSAGWRVLVDRCRKGPEPRLRLVAMQPGVHEVYALLGIQYVVASHETVAEALAAFAGEAVPAPVRGA